MSGTTKVFSVTLTILRFLLAVWVGAAVLYVIVSIAEVKSPHFGAAIKDQLVTLRFPLYYKFGFIVHIICGTMGFLAWRSATPQNSRRMLSVLLLVIFSGIAISLDYRFIYQPLQNLIIPPGQPRTEDFEQLHHWSRSVNELHIGLMFLASIIAAVPLKPNQDAA